MDTPRPSAEGQFILLITFICFSYIFLGFLRLRWPDETSFWPLLLSLLYFFYYILLSFTGIGLWGVSGRVNANCTCPCRTRIWVDANCSYIWTPISLICRVVFIKSIMYLIIYFVFISVYTDSINIFRLVFCQNLCKITHNVGLFCCKFLKNIKENVVNRFPSKPWEDYLFWLKVRWGIKIWRSFQANFIGFFCRVIIRHYCNNLRKLIPKYSNDSKDHKGYKSQSILLFVSVMLNSLA